MSEQADRSDIDATGGKDLHAEGSPEKAARELRDRILSPAERDRIRAKHADKIEADIAESKAFFESLYERAVWGVFIAAKDRRQYPNFYPIGLAETREAALALLEGLPTAETYQLFQLPVDRVFAGVDGDRVVSVMGLLNHEHLGPDED